MNKLKKIFLILSIIFTSSISFAAESMVGQVNGMMCIKCQNMVTMELIKVSPTAHVKVSWPEGVAVSAFEEKSNLSLEEFKKAILGTGFEVVKVVKADKFITEAGEARKLVD
jgi:copper chaperone